MPFVRPTLPDLLTRIRQDFVSSLQLTGAVLRRSMVAVLSRVLAGAAHMLHGHLEYLAQQLFADTAESTYLLRLASIRGLSPKPATFATARVTFTGTIGVSVDSGTYLLRSDGAQYTVDDEVDFDLTGTGYVTAVLSGAAGTLSAGMVLAFQSPLEGVDATVMVEENTGDGTDQESVDELRARLLEVLRNPPQGGAESDYSVWAKQVAGVTRVWVAPRQLGAGTVVVRFVRDDDVSGIFPDAGEVAAVQAHLNSVAPVTAAVTVLAPTEAPLALTLSVAPDTGAVRAAVEAEVADLLRRTATANGGTLYLSQLRTAIGSASGVVNYVLTAPDSDVVLAPGQLATVGAITWD